MKPETAAVETLASVSIQCAVEGVVPTHGVETEEIATMLSTPSLPTVNGEAGRVGDPFHPTTRIAPNVIFKEDFDYEGRTRIEKTKDKLLLNYDAYLKAHPEITPLLHDVVLNLLIHQPDRPLKEIRSYVRSRMGL